MSGHDAVVVGSGPNGLAAAITLARAGRSVLVREGAETIGGGTRSAMLTLPGFLHDVCSAVHPLAAGSPFFRSLPLVDHGLELVHPAAALAHPLDDGTAVLAYRSIEATARSLGGDGARYERLLGAIAADWQALEHAVLGPLLQPPRHPLAMARFALAALRSASGLASSAFGGERARALFAGAAAHSILPLERVASASFGLVLLGLAHVFGWPVARGGSQQIASALASCLRSLGGEIATGAPVVAFDELRGYDIVMLDTSPRQLVALAGDRLTPRYRRALRRFRYGPGVFKIDYALDSPVPWRASGCGDAATVHVGGSLAEIAAAERAPWEGRHAERPFVLVAQPSLFDQTRAPADKQTLWAYCHVPSGSTVDMTGPIERQIERFAPGFRDRVLARSTLTTRALEAANPNLVGGDINGGAGDLRQLVARPVIRPVPYATPIEGVFLCSASTPPGGGVHGMCGYLGASAALAQRRRRLLVRRGREQTWSADESRQVPR